VAAAALAAGCPPRAPKAPPLTPEAVFENAAIGLRFLAPAGWVLQSRATLPDGPLPKPVVVVSYQQSASGKPSDFTLLAADVPEDTDPLRYLDEHAVGATRWALRSPPEVVTVNGTPATRFAQGVTRGKDELRREATAFRRGGRLYFFLVTFAPGDEASRDAVRTALGSVTWTK
jgi:hypothetical protein